MDDMHETLVILPPAGGFELERIHRYLATVPYAVRDARLQHVYVIAKSYQQLESAIEMSANEGRFPYSSSLIYSWPERIEITFDDETAALARSLASWLEREPQATPRIGEMDEGFPVGATLCDGALLSPESCLAPRPRASPGPAPSRPRMLVTLGRRRRCRRRLAATAMRVDGIRRCATSVASRARAKRSTTRWSSSVRPASPHRHACSYRSTLPWPRASSTRSRTS